MAKKRKHSTREIIALLAQADNLAGQGKLQPEIARTLGVSVMTLHRWRKIARIGGAPKGRSGDEPKEVIVPSGQESKEDSRIAELELEVVVQSRRIVLLNYERQTLSPRPTFRDRPFSPKTAGTLREMQ